MRTKKGFTLIELLVVIAIIGILASIVLVSFPGATKKAKDARIVSAIAQGRTVMTYINANDGNYDNLPGACTATAPPNPYYSDMKPLCDEVAANGPTDDNTLYLRKGTDANGNPAGCVYAKLSAKADYWYCADSTGRAGSVSGTNPGGTVGAYCAADASPMACPTFD